MGGWMNILVTGGAGFIGSHVVDRYIQEGHTVTIVDDLSTGRLSNINSSAKFYNIDIRDSQLSGIFADGHFDVVNHHAAQVDVRRSTVNPLLDAEINILGSLNVLECARSFGVQKFIYISSGGAAYGEPEYLPCDETHPINPICPYGASKHTVEHYVYLYSLLYGMSYAVIRYPNVYGPRQNPNGEAGVVAIFAGKMLAGNTIHINGDGNQIRDFVYVDDCVHANVLLLDSKINKGIFNLGWNRGHTINEVFSILDRITGYAKAPVHAGAIPGETRSIYINAEKAKKELGWEPTVDLEQGLRRVVEYLKSHELDTRDTPLS
jgi:UDP-glucose 4-epimerase